MDRGREIARRRYGGDVMRKVLREVSEEDWAPNVARRALRGQKQQEFDHHMQGLDPAKRRYNRMMEDRPIIKKSEGDS